MRGNLPWNVRQPTQFRLEKKKSFNLFSNNKRMFKTRAEKRRKKKRMSENDSGWILSGCCVSAVNHFKVKKKIKILLDQSPNTQFESLFSFCLSCAFAYSFLHFLFHASCHTCLFYNFWCVTEMSSFKMRKWRQYFGASRVPTVLTLFIFIDVTDVITAVFVTLKLLLWEFYRSDCRCVFASADDSNAV